MHTFLRPLFAAERKGEKAQLEKVFRYLCSIVFYFVNQTLHSNLPYFCGV